MFLDLLAAGILGLFVLMGALRGAVTSGLGLATLGLGYVAALVAARQAGPAFAQAVGAPAILGAPLAGSAAFAVVFVLGGFVGMGLKAWDRRRRGNDGRGRLDRAFGGIFGGLRGALIVLMISWLAIWLDAARELSGGEKFAAAPPVENSVVAGATGRMVELAVASAMSDAGPGARVAARMASNPADAMKSVRALLEDRRFQAVQDDKLFWTYVQNGSVQSALNRGSFYNIVNDPGLRGDLAELGLIGQDAVEDPGVFRDAAADVLTELGPRLKGLSEDQEIQDLAKDPEVIAMLESGNTIGLIAHPGVQRVVTRLSEGL